MNHEDMKVGRVYLIKGGHVLRYHGPWGGKGPCLAFQSVRCEVSSPPVGASISIDEVLHEVTKEDLDWIRYRRGECASRNLQEEAANMDHLLKELGS